MWHVKAIAGDLPEFFIFHNHSCDRFQSSVHCVKPSANISIHEEYYGRSPIVISKAKRSPLLKVLLFYRKNNENLSLFNQNLPQINSGNFFVIIMSDFNINDLHQDCQIWQILSNYVQVMTEPTHISGSLLNHIYIQKYILDSME